DTWRDYQRLIASCHIVVVTRPGYEIALEERRKNLSAAIKDLRGKREPIGEVTNDSTIFLTDLLELDISATVVRAAAAQGESITEWVPESVAHYINKYRLYQDKNETNN